MDERRKNENINLFNPRTAISERLGHLTLRYSLPGRGELLISLPRISGSDKRETETRDRDRQRQNLEARPA